MRERDLGEALGLFLQKVTSTAALTDAVLETRSFQLGVPRAADAALVCGAAHRLWRAGFHVTFGPSFRPAPAADLALGTGGADGAFLDFIHETDFWEVVPRHP